MAKQILATENGWIQTLDEIAQAVSSRDKTIVCTPLNQAQKEALLRIGFTEVQHG